MALRFPLHSQANMDGTLESLWRQQMVPVQKNSLDPDIEDSNKLPSAADLPSFITPTSSSMISSALTPDAQRQRYSGRKLRTLTELRSSDRKQQPQSHDHQLRGISEGNTHDFNTSLKATQSFGLSLFSLSAELRVEICT
jgi:hypothetical protein